MAAVQSLFGLLVLTLFAWAIGENRRAQGPRAALKTAAAGLALLFVLALLFLKLPLFRQVFLWLNSGVVALQEATRTGTAFVFGYLGGAPLPFQESFPGASFVLAFQALPLILVTSALAALLYHWRVLPWIVQGFAWGLQRTLGVGGAVGVSTAANVFVGMIEAPLFIRPYLVRLTRSELFVVMTGGMASIAGTVMALYAVFLTNVIPDAIGHILIASILSAPASIMVARLMVPESVDAGGEAAAIPPSPDRSAMEAVTRGALEGVVLLTNVLAMLVVLVALVSLVNMALALLPEMAGAPLTLERILGWIMAPVVWLVGIPWGEAPVAGALMGTKTVLNELLAYLQMKGLPEGALSERSRLIMVYALCGFANFGSLGIMLGGLSAMVPERRAEIVGLGMKSILSGTLATLIIAAVVGSIT